MAYLQRHLILLLTLGLLCSVGAKAQSATPAPPPPATFRLLSLGSVEAMYYAPEKRTTRRVSLSTSNYSRPYPVPASGVVSFFRLSPAEKPELPPVRIPVGEIQIGQRQPGDSIIVILVPGGMPGLPLPLMANGQPAEFACRILDDSPSVHPRDTLRVISFSKRPAGVQFASAGTQILTLESKVIPYPSGDRAMLQIASFTNNMWTPVVSSLQMLAPDTRITLFLSDIPPSSDNPAPTEITYRKVAEVLPPASESN